jgi:hypothetical protein
MQYKTFRVLRNCGAVLLVLLLAVTIAVFSGCDLFGNKDSGDDDGGDGDGAGTEGDMLEELGITKDEQPRQNVQEEHPLESSYLTYQKKTEIYISGVYTHDAAIGAGKDQVLLDDSSGEYSVLYSSAGEQWVKYPATTAAANVDDDYNEEVVILYYNQDTDKALIKTMDYDDSGTPVFSDGQELGTFTAATRESWFQLMIAPGDVDGDGRDELAVIIGSQFLLLDDKTANFAALFTKDFDRNSDYQVTTAAMGNIDTDREPEIIIADGINDQAASSTYYIYSYSDGTMNLEAGGGTAVIREGGDYSTAYEFANVAAGDVDGDGVEELLFAGDVGDGGNWSLTVMNYDGEKTDILTTLRRPGHWWYQFMPALTAFQADGNATGKKEEIFCYQFVLELDSEGKLVDKWSAIDGEDNAADSYPGFGRFSTGDVNGDGCEDIAFLTGEEVEERRFIVLGYKDGKFGKIKNIDIDMDTVTTGEGAYNSTVCAVNLDDDSDIIEYNGEYELLYTKPQVIAVLASPPYYENQDTDDLETTFAWSQGTSSTTGDTFGFYVGFSIGYSAETPLWGTAGSAEFKANINAAFDWTFTQTQYQVITKTFTCMAGENQVIFASTPMDVYYYEVVSSSDPGQIGEKVTIQIPRDPQIKQMDAEIFNSIVPEDLRISDIVISHDLGDPWTYPERADMLTLFQEGSTVTYEGSEYDSVIPVTDSMGGFRTPDPFLLSIDSNSTGKQTIEIETGEEKGQGFNFDFEVGAEFETISGGLLVGGSAGFHYGYEQNFTTTEATIISGTLGNYEDSSSRTPYRCGLMAYPYPNSALTGTYSTPFVVVTYWVQE